MDKLITIIIPFFNRLNLVKRAVYSVFSQTYKNWELILVNDNSSDDLSELYAMAKGPLGQNIIMLNNSLNCGPGYSRNRGLQIASGEYICFLDSDDFLLPNFLTETYNCINENLLFVYTTSNWENGSVYKTSNLSYTQVLPVILQYSRPWTTSSILWNRKYIVTYDQLIFNWEDYLFEFKSALNKNKIIHIPMSLCIIGGVNNSNLSNFENTEKGLNDRIYALNQMFESLEGNIYQFKINLYRLIIKKYCFYLIQLLNSSLKIDYNNISSRLKIIPINRLVLRLILKLTKAFD